jgi:hypothetical protein
MTIGVIATIPVQEGKNAEFEAAFMELAAQVLANEPGCRFYARTAANPIPKYTKCWNPMRIKPRSTLMVKRSTLKPLI